MQEGFLAASMRAGRPCPSAQRCAHVAVLGGPAPVLRCAHVAVPSLQAWQPALSMGGDGRAQRPGALPHGSGDTVPLSFDLRHAGGLFGCKHEGWEALNLCSNSHV